LITLVACEGFVAHHEATLSTGESAIAKRVGRAAREHVRGSEVLFFGDSLVKFGVIPRVFEERLGRQAYNLAIPGGQPVGDYFMLRRALHSGATPKAIVVDFKANCIATPPSVNLRQWTELLTLRECAELAYSERDASYFLSLVLGKALPSYKTRWQLRAFVLAALAEQPLPTKAMAVTFWRNSNVNKGAIVASDGSKPPWPDEDNLAATYYPPAWDIHPTNAVYMRKFFALAAEHHIAVLWLLPPIRAEFQARREQRGCEEIYLRRAAEPLAQYPNLVLVDARHAHFPDTVFSDPSHLVRSGALALSAGLAEVVGSVLDRPDLVASRVIALPGFRSIALDPPPEDCPTSMALLGLGPGPVRK
jgi:hypothetical protein